MLTRECTTACPPPSPNPAVSRKAADCFMESLNPGILEQFHIPPPPPPSSWQQGILHHMASGKGTQLGDDGFKLLIFANSCAHKQDGGWDKLLAILVKMAGLRACLPVL